jgi:hypothetical protein
LPRLDGDVPADEALILSVLDGMAKAGLIAREVEVSRYDSTEYVVTWSAR